MAGLVVTTDAAAALDGVVTEVAMDVAGVGSPEAGSPEAGSSGLAVSDIAASDILTPQEIVVADPLPQTQAEAVELALAAALADVPVEDAAAGETTPVLIKSVRPRLRPVAAVATDASMTDLQQVAAVAPVEIDPTTIAAGTRLVQLGAFDDEPAARAEWTKLQGRFAELINDKAIIVQPAQSGGRTFYRLRAHGFEGEDEARRFCAALLAENASCIPVAQR